MRRAILLGAALVAALFLSACGTDKEFLRAQAESITAQANARVEEAKAAAEDSRAVIALSAKIDASGAAAYLALKGAKGLIGASAAAPAQRVERPRDWLDYLQGGASVLATFANAATPIIGIRETGKTTRAGYDRDVKVEGLRQAGETGRIQSVAGIASQVAASRPNVTIDVGRDANFGGSQANNNSTTDRHDVIDRHDSTDRHDTPAPTTP